jgi:hypothetical protein
MGGAERDTLKTMSCFPQPSSLRRSRLRDGKFKYKKVPGLGLARGKENSLVLRLAARQQYSSSTASRDFNFECRLGAAGVGGVATCTNSMSQHPWPNLLPCPPPPPPRTVQNCGNSSGRSTIHMNEISVYTSGVPRRACVWRRLGLRSVFLAFSVTSPLFILQLSLFT